MKLDFFAPAARPAWFAWLLLGLGLAAALWTLQSWNAATVEQHRVETRLASLQGPAAPRQAKPARKPKREDAGGLNRQRADAAARDQLQLPWARLLETLQDIRTPEIALLSLEADGRRGDFTLAGLAMNHAAMLDFFDSLQHAPGFAQVSLTRHELRELEGEQRVHFTLRGDWTRP
jgi:Tfp pilus assembly protein PilN